MINAEGAHFLERPSYNSSSEDVRKKLISTREQFEGGVDKVFQAELRYILEKQLLNFFLAFLSLHFVFHRRLFLGSVDPMIIFNGI